MALFDRARGYLTVRMRKDWNFRRVMETAPAMRWLDAQRGERILDIGCGEGTYNYRMARCGAVVVGFDLDLKALRAATDHHGGRGVVYLQSDADAIPVKSNSFDTVVSLCVFEHLHDDGQVLREAHRALRPDGRLLLTLDSLSRPDVPKGWRDRHRKKHAVRQFYTVPTIKAKLEQHGFQLNRSKYLLSSSVDMRVIRWSYATERMHPVPAAIVRTFLITVGRLVCTWANARSRAENGWTLLIEASRV